MTAFKLMLVDDESRILEGLERTLIDRLDDADVRSFTSAAAALDAIALDPPDVLITDMRMPQMDGAALLKRVHDTWPGVVRMVLSGQMDDASALAAAPHAHQFLTKPCPADSLEEAVLRAVSLRGILACDRLRAAVGAVDALPPLPAVYLRLQNLLLDPRTSLTDITALLQTDAALVAKIMQLATSSFFGRGPLKDLHTAVSRIGVKTLQALVLSAGVFAETGHQRLAKTANLRRLHEQALRRAHVVGAIAKGDQQALLAALLCDVGLLVLAIAAPDAFDEVDARVVAGADRLAAEHEVHGVTHPDVGAYLLGLWGLPMNVVDAVRCHHDPLVAQAGNEALAANTYVAAAVADGLALDEDALVGLLGAEQAACLCARAQESA